MRYRIILITLVLQASLPVRVYLNNLKYAVYTNCLNAINYHSPEIGITNIMISTIKKLPRISLALVLLTYSVFGWILSQENLPRYAWFLIVIGILFLIAVLTTPWSKASQSLKTLFNTKLKSFGFTVLGAFLFFLIVAHFRIFLDFMLIISVTILVRLDFQTTSFTEIQAFCLTSVFSIGGLMLGLLSNQLI